MSSDLTRDVGIAAGVTGVVHVACSFWVHLTTTYPALPSRVVHYITGDRKVVLANVVGAIALVNLVFLTAISADWALRGLGRRRWKQLQRTNYALVALVVAHTALYWSILERTRRIEVLTIVALGVVLALQLRGIGLYRARRAAHQLTPIPTASRRPRGAALRIHTGDGSMATTFDPDPSIVERRLHMSPRRSHTACTKHQPNGIPRRLSCSASLQSEDGAEIRAAGGCPGTPSLATTASGLDSKNSVRTVTRDSRSSVTVA